MLYTIFCTMNCDFKSLRPDVVAQACDPGYLKGGDWEEYGLRPADSTHSQDLISANGCA
jgi:hypothetical protein